MKVFGKNTDNLSDQEILLLYAKKKNPELIGILYKRYAHLVFGVCMKYFKNEADAKDAVINIYEKLILDLAKHDVKIFKSWLFMVSKNHCLMALRKGKKEIPQGDFIENNITENPDNNINSVLEKEERLTKLERAIQQLKQEQRTCIELFYLKEKSYTEISSLTGYNLKEVKSYLQNGKRNLQKLMEH